jgi:hypothetical protein
MRRAALVITDADRVTGQGYEGEGWRAVSWFSERTSEQLLADLRLLLKAGAYIAKEYPVAAEEEDLLLLAVARVRALLPEEES